jgi:Leucine-rich repeat (LRR) protein
MRFLFLERGDLSGPIPEEIGNNLHNLMVLDLDFNKLSSTLPSSLFNLHNLVQLDLNNNFLSGTISPKLANLPLIFLQLQANRFTGTIPSQVATMTDLRESTFLCLCLFLGSTSQSIYPLRNIV